MGGGSLDEQDIIMKSSFSRGFHRIRRDWVEPIFIALFLALIIRTFIFQPFKIPSGSMEDTLLVGDQLIAAKFFYGVHFPFLKNPVLKVRGPKPGDVIVFKYPEDPSKDFIKRCIAVGGQTVEIRNKEVFVNGVLQVLPRHAKFIDSTILPSQFGPRDNFGPCRIPAGNMFVMGDNRDNSNDSRFWNFVPYSNIRAKAVLVYWSWDSGSIPRNMMQRVRWGRLLTGIR
jgi:signal peptidase I